MRRAVGYVDGAVPAATAWGGDAAYVGRTLVPAGAMVKSGGVAWVGEAPICEGTIKKTGAACPVKPVENERYCVGHLRAHAREVAAAKEV